MSRFLLPFPNHCAGFPRFFLLALAVYFWEMRPVVLPLFLGAPRFRSTNSFVSTPRSRCRVALYLCFAERLYGLFRGASYTLQCIHNYPKRSHHHIGQEKRRTVHVLLVTSSVDLRLESEDPCSPQACQLHPAKRTWHPP